MISDFKKRLESAQYPHKIYTNDISTLERALALIDEIQIKTKPNSEAEVIGNIHDNKELLREE